MQLMPWKRQHGTERGLTLRDAMNQLFDESFWDPTGFLPDSSLFPAQHERQFLPKFDVAETEKELQIVAEVPGYDPKNVHVRMENGILTIEGTMEEDKEEKHKKWYRRETSRGNFLRQVSLPQGVSEKDVRCTMKHGKLTIAVQKSKEVQSQAKTLQITTE